MKFNPASVTALIFSATMHVALASVAISHYDLRRVNHVDQAQLGAIDAEEVISAYVARESRAPEEPKTDLAYQALPSSISSDNTGKIEQLKKGKEHWAPSVLKAHEKNYYSIDELSEKPSVIQDIPDSIDQALFHVPGQIIKLRLFINEHGNVDYVEVEESALPAAAEAALINAFLSSRFSPGKIIDSSVKSQLRVAVKIDNLEH